MNFFRQLGFTGRLVAIAFLAIIALATSTATMNFYLNWQQPEPENQILLPQRASAMVDLIEQANGQQRELILNVLNSETLAVKIQSVRPTDMPESNRLPAVEWVVKQTISSSEKREVVVTSQEVRGNLLSRLGVSHKRLFAREPLRIAISLLSGEWLLLETKVEISTGIFGFPPGFFVGFIGACVGIFALLAVAREAKPLRDLAGAVSDFGKDAGPRYVKPQGAPEFKVLIATVNEMQVKIASLLKGRTILLGAISHDLKTYISRLRMRVEGIADEKQQSKAIDDLNEMTLVIDDSLAIAKGDGVSTRRETIDLVGLLQKNVADRHNRSVVFEKPRPTAKYVVDADPVALNRLIDNILNNAAQFGSHVVVSLQTAPDRVRILVDDNGPGIPKNERVAVFEPFYRLEQSRSRTTGGSGLGLAIAKQIAQTHNGTIEIDDSPLGGTRIVLTLPQADTA